MFIKKEERKYSVLYKNEVWWLKVSTFSIIWNKRDLKKDLETKGIFIQKIIDLDSVISYAKNIHWSIDELFNFTNIFRLELSKWAYWVVPVRDVIKEVYKKTFNPLVYAIWTEIENNRKFEDIIDDFPNIFDDIYRSTIKWYWWEKHLPVEWLIKLEEYIKEKQAFRRKVIDKTRTSFITISAIVVLSYVLDWVIYEWINKNFISLGRELPDFTQAYHRWLWLIIKYIGMFFIMFWLLIWYYKLLKWKKIKIFLWKLKFAIPFFWKIHKKKCVYDIIDTFIIMRESDIMQRELLQILAKSANNFYLEEIILSVRKEVIWWKQLGSSLEEYWFFTWADDDVIHAFKAKNIDESMLSLKSVKKVELDQLTSKILRLLTSAMLVLTLVLWLSMWFAYYKPVQMQSWLIKDKINADKEASLDYN